jgi:hypothetical protein
LLYLSELEPQAIYSFGLTSPNLLYRLVIISRDHRGPAPEGGLAGWATWGRDLAAATGLHRNTITNIEVGRYASDSATLTLIKDVFMREGVDFIDENGGGAGVRLRKSPSRWYRLRQGVRRTEKLKRLSYIQTMGDRRAGSPRHRGVRSNRDRNWCRIARDLDDY